MARGERGEGLLPSLHPPGADSSLPMETGEHVFLGLAREWKKYRCPPDLTFIRVYMVRFVPETKPSSAVPLRDTTSTAAVSFREHIFHNENQLC